MNSNQRLSLITVLSFVALIGFSSSSLALQNIRADSNPAYLYCDIASQFYFNGTVIPLASRPTPTICGPPIYIRWMFTGIILVHFFGCITMYNQVSIGDSYGALVKNKPKVVDSGGYTAKELTQNQKGKRTLTMAVAEKRGCCRAFFDGFYFVHVLAIPAIWFVFYILQAEAKVSAIFGAWALQVIISFVKVAPILDAYSRWAPLAGAVFYSLSVTEAINLIWWGVYIIQVFSYDDTHRSGWLVSWWILLVLYAGIITWIIGSTLGDDNVRHDELPSAVLQKARVTVLVVDSFYLWMSGFIVFMFIE